MNEFDIHTLILAWAHSFFTMATTISLAFLDTRSPSKQSLCDSGQVTYVLCFRFPICRRLIIIEPTSLNFHEG